MHPVDGRSADSIHRAFTLLPGVNIGDIGKKMGRDGIGEERYPLFLS